MQLKHDSLSISKRNYGLDVLRALSIWLVLLQHAGINIPGLAPLKIGAIGVEIFFVLSGFLIGSILLREIDKLQPFTTTLVNFWIRRWYRILPLYFLALGVKFIFYEPEIGWNILYYIFFLQNNFYGIQFLDVSWSLVIEEWFYLFSPVFLYLLNKFSSSKKQILLSIFGFILMVIIARFCYVIFTNAPYSGINGNFPFRFDSLFIGVTVAFLKKNFYSIYTKMQSKKFLVLGLTIFFTYIYYFWTRSNEVYLIDEILFPRVLGFFILPFSVGLILPWVESNNFISLRSDTLSRTIYLVITWTSILTYAIYLSHPFIYQHFLHNDWSEIYILKFTVSIVILYLVALGLYHGFENPILKLRDRYTSK